MIGLRILSAIPALTAIALVSGAAEAGPKVDRSCTGIPGSVENCAPLVDCLGSTGIYFTYHDNQTGTATGQGLMSDGRPVRMWSGRNIRQFLINESGDVNARLMCGDVPVPIS